MKHNKKCMKHVSFIGWGLPLTCHGEYTNIPKLKAWNSPSPKHFHKELTLATSPWKFSWLSVKFLIMGLFLNLSSSDGLSYPVLQPTVAIRSPRANTGAQSLALLPFHLQCLSWDRISSLHTTCPGMSPVEYQPLWHHGARLLTHRSTWKFLNVQRTRQA